MKIQLRYCSVWNYEPKALSLVGRVLTEFKQKLASLELVPSTGGCFEFSIDGTLTYSKLKTGTFQDEEEIVREVRRRL